MFKHEVWKGPSCSVNWKVEMQEVGETRRPDVDLLIWKVSEMPSLSPGVSGITTTPGKPSLEGRIGVGNPSFAPEPHSTS